MKKRKTQIVACISGLVCALGLFLFMNNVKAEFSVAQEEALASYGGDQVNAYVAKRNISGGEVIDASCFEEKTMIASLLPKEATLNTADFLGKKTNSVIYAGEVFVAGRFTEDASTLEVPSGFSAVSLPAPSIQSVGGALSPGMRVNVYATGSSKTVCIARSVLVLANSDVSANSNSAFVTLAVQSEKIQELISAAENTTLYFSLPSEEETLGSQDEKESSEEQSLEEQRKQEANVSPASNTRQETTAQQTAEEVTL